MPEEVIQQQTAPEEDKKVEDLTEVANRPETQEVEPIDEKFFEELHQKVEEIYKKGAPSDPEKVEAFLGHVRDDEKILLELLELVPHTREEEENARIAIILHDVAKMNNELYTFHSDYWDFPTWIVEHPEHSAEMAKKILKQRQEEGSKILTDERIERITDIIRQHGKMAYTQKILEQDYNPRQAEYDLPVYQYPEPNSKEAVLVRAADRIAPGMLGANLRKIAIFHRCKSEVGDPDYNEDKTLIDGDPHVKCRVHAAVLHTGLKDNIGLLMEEELANPDLTEIQRKVGALARETYQNELDSFIAWVEEVWPPERFDEGYQGKKGFQAIQVGEDKNIDINATNKNFIEAEQAYRKITNRLSYTGKTGLPTTSA